MQAATVGVRLVLGSKPGGNFARRRGRHQLIDQFAGTVAAYPTAPAAANVVTDLGMGVSSMIGRHAVAGLVDTEGGWIIRIAETPPAGRATADIARKNDPVVINDIGDPPQSDLAVEQLTGFAAQVVGKSGSDRRHLSVCRRMVGCDNPHNEDKACKRRNFHVQHYSLTVCPSPWRGRADKKLNGDSRLLLSTVQVPATAVNAVRIRTC